jgi:hypothetical protein
MAAKALPTCQFTEGEKKALSLLLLVSQKNGPKKYPEHQNSFGDR